MESRCPTGRPRLRCDEAVRRPSVDELRRVVDSTSRRTSNIGDVWTSFWTSSSTIFSYAASLTIRSHHDDCARRPARCLLPRSDSVIHEGVTQPLTLNGIWPARPSPPAHRPINRRHIAAAKTSFYRPVRIKRPEKFFTGKPSHQNYGVPPKYGAHDFACCPTVSEHTSP